MGGTIRDVAKGAGVCISTVSNALNNRWYVSATTKARILKVAKKLDYHPSGIARSLVRRKTENIGFILYRNPERLFSNPFYSRIVDGVEEQVLTQGYNLLISAFDIGSKDQALPKLIREKNVDGLILAGAISKDFILVLRKEGFPIVLVDNYLKNEKINCVVIDNTHGAVDAVEYLFKLGHKKIGFLCGPPLHISNQERFKGYKLRLDELGIKFDRSIVAQGDNTIEGGYNAMQKLLEKISGITAVFACNDDMAIGAMRAIREKGLEIPDDISLMGFDDIEMAAHTQPPLTTIRVPKEEMGRVAATMLISELEGVSQKAGLRIVMPAELVIRQSCLPKKK